MSMTTITKAKFANEIVEGDVIIYARVAKLTGEVVVSLETVESIDRSTFSEAGKVDQFHFHTSYAFGRRQDQKGINYITRDSYDFVNVI